uniref:Uncharacterized protein n=1 Tax=Globodera rostochiensis TaxID=31243 RepID=A0A914IDX5_GLORO
MVPRKLPDCLSLLPPICFHVFRRMNLDPKIYWEIIWYRIWPLIEDNIYGLDLYTFQHAPRGWLSEGIFKSTDPVNFIIYLFYWTGGGIVPFELQNIFTGKRLVFRHFEKDNWLLVRCPIERDEAKWAEWEEAAAWNLCKWNCIGIDFEDSDIGDGLLDTNEGPVNRENE